MFPATVLLPHKCHEEMQQTIFKKIVGQKDRSPIKYKLKYKKKGKFKFSSFYRYYHAFL